MVKTWNVYQGIVACQAHDLAENVCAGKPNFLDLSCVDDVQKKSDDLLLKELVVFQAVLFDRLLHDFFDSPLVHDEEAQNILDLYVSIGCLFEAVHDFLSEFLVDILAVEKFSQNAYFFDEDSLRGE
jgi:hypothetical protein